MDDAYGGREHEGIDKQGYGEQQAECDKDDGEDGWGGWMGR